MFFCACVSWLLIADNGAENHRQEGGSPSQSAGGGECHIHVVMNAFRIHHHFVALTSFGLHNVSVTGKVHLYYSSPRPSADPLCGDELC